MRRTLTAAAMALLAVTTTLLASPGAAQAAWPYSMSTDDADPGGRVRFAPDGDVVEICDIEADGWAAQVDVWNYTEGNTKIYSYQIGGDGNCQTLRASLGGKWDLEERDTFKFRVCLDNSSHDPSYCDYAYWTNDNGIS
jgi:hypothetical protein